MHHHACFLPQGGISATGFALTAADQLAYNRFLAAAAHALGLAIGLKNDVGQTAALVSVKPPSQRHRPFVTVATCMYPGADLVQVSQFDFAVNEQCWQYSECDTYRPFISAGKPVYNIEYSFYSDAAFLGKVRPPGGMSSLEEREKGGHQQFE